jgi:PAS domain S-box-containing protein
MLGEMTAQAAESGSEQRTRLLGQLQQHQRELEQQNRTLEESRNALEAVRDRYSELYDFAPVAYLTLDREGVIRDLNLTATGLLGRSRPVLRDKPLGALLAPGTSADLRAHLRQAYATREQTTGHLRLQSSRGGAVRYVRVESRVRAEPGGEESCLTALIDVTDSLQREEELQTLRLAVEQSANGINITDTAGTILYANTASELMYGYGRGELCGRHVQILNSEPEVSLQEIIPAVRKDGGWSGTLSQRRKDGSCFDAHLSASLVERDGTPIGMLGVVRDITEERMAERAIRRTEERLNALINATAEDVVVLLDADLRMEIVNERAARGFGRSPQEMTGKPMDAFMPRDVARTRMAFARRVIEGGQPLRFEDERAGHWFDNNMCPVLSEDGTAEGVAIFARDITERKRMEQALAAAKDMAEQANLAKSRFLSAANHDLRQPLQAMRLLIESLSLGGADPKAGEILEEMQVALQSMEGLLNALLDISKLEAGSVHPEPIDFQAAPFLDRLRSQFKATAREAGKTIRLFPADALLRTDPELLARILQNFIANAIRHARSEAILVGIRRAGRLRRIEVWDNGEGIPADQLEVIFEDFYQIGNPARDSRRGLGLGLAVARRMANLLELRIGVRSWPGRGSVFSVEVPAGQASPGESIDARRPPAPAKPGNGLILVVDDSPIVLKATARLLHGLGYGAVYASSAEEALELVARHAGRLWFVVLDYRLPKGWNGIRLLERIRSAVGRQVPGVLISGDTSIDDLIDVRRSGLPLLQKPIDPNVLRHHLHGAAPIARQLPLPPGDPP